MLNRREAWRVLACLAGCQITQTQTLAPINELHKLQLKPWALIQWKWQPVKHAECQRKKRGKTETSTEVNSSLTLMQNTLFFWLVPHTCKNTGRMSYTVLCKGVLWALFRHNIFNKQYRVSPNITRKMENTSLSFRVYTSHTSHTAQTHKPAGLSSETQWTQVMGDIYCMSCF